MTYLIAHHFTNYFQGVFREIYFCVERFRILTVNRGMFGALRCAFFPLPCRFLKLLQKVTELLFRRLERSIAVVAIVPNLKK